MWDELVQTLNDVREWLPDDVPVSFDVEYDEDGDLWITFYVMSKAVAEESVTNPPTFEQVVEGTTEMYRSLSELIANDNKSLRGQMQALIDKHAPKGISG